MKKTLAPLQSKIIGYSGYLIAFILLAQILYRFLVAPFILTFQEEVVSQEFVLQVGGDLISHLLTYGVMAIIVKIISDAVLQGKKWGLVICGLASVFVLISSIGRDDYLFLFMSLSLLICCISVLNHKFYNRS